MNENVQIQEGYDDEINLWELMEHLKSGWHWIVGGVGAGLLCTTWFLMLTPAQYEATAVIQPATVGMIFATPTPTEPIAQTLERLKLRAFYGDDVVKSCQVDSAKDLAGGVKVAIVKGNNLISIAYRADSVAIAQACMAKIVGRLTHSQAAIAAPLIKELKNQLALTKQQIDDIERVQAQNEKRLARSLVSNESVLLMLKKEELSRLQKLYREQSIQLSEPFTQPIKLLEPIDISEEAISPKKGIITAVGLITGLFAGLLALFVNRSWRRYRSVPV